MALDFVLIIGLLVIIVLRRIVVLIIVYIVLLSLLSEQGTTSTTSNLRLFVVLITVLFIFLAEHYNRLFKCYAFSGSPDFRNSFVTSQLAKSHYYNVVGK
jgi:hypothetical protein